jgi:hypothetical protein
MNSQTTAHATGPVASARSLRVSDTPEYLENELGVAAYLVARGFRLLGLKEVALGRFSFRFADDAEGSTAQAALDYLTGSTVVAKDLVSAERSLKTLLYSRPQNGLGTRNFNSNKKGKHEYRTSSQ